MVRKTVSYNTILKRSRCLNSSLMESTNVDSQKIFTNLKKSISVNENGRNAATQQLLRSYIEAMCDSNNASKYYYQIFDLLEMFNNKDNAISDRILAEFSNRILPYVNDMSLVLEDIERSNQITDQQRLELFNEAKLYSVSDRILKNHEHISKRFNIEKECNRIRTVGLKYFIDSCADMIDTYNMKEYQKLNLTLEECFFLLEKNHISYNKKDMIQNVVEYYLIQNPYISFSELNNFRKAINENYILTESDFDNINYLLSPNTDEAPKSISDGIHKYLVSPDKEDTNSVSDMVKSTLKCTNKQDIIANIDKLIYLLWDFVKNKTFDSDDCVYKAFGTIPEYINNYTKLVDADIADDYTKEDLESIIGRLNEIKKEITLIGNSNPMYSSPASDFIRLAINPALDTLISTKDILYNRSNLVNMNLLNRNNIQSVSLNEFKIFKFHNLVNAAIHLDKFLRVKEQRLSNSMKQKRNAFIKKTKSILFGESENPFAENEIYKYIGEDCKADICVREYIYRESELSELTAYLENICNEYNDILTSKNMDTVKAYYIINPNIAEINIKEATRIELTESEYQKVNSSLDTSLDLYLSEFVEASSQIHYYDGFIGESIEERLLNFDKYQNFTYDHFELALEAMSYLNIDPYTVKTFGEKFSDYQFNKAIQDGVVNESYVALSKQEKQVLELTESWRREEDVPAAIQLEAYGYLLDIISEAGYNYNDQDDDNSDDDESEKEYQEYLAQRKAAREAKKKGNKVPEQAPAPAKVEQPKKSNITKNYQVEHDDYKEKQENKMQKTIMNIRLGLNGIKQKFKDMNAKQKEASMNLDNSVRSVVSSMKNAIVSDRREYILKGQLIPSFSRFLKSAIGLTILGCATGSVAIPVITAIGGLAVSKRLNDKERGLLLDEIETELEVVEKELSIADSNNQMNKYRTLLQYKKELQRQYQRIRYNIRVGKDILPSTVGMVANSAE